MDQKEGRTYRCRVAGPIHGKVTAAVDYQKIDRLGGDVGDGAAHRAAQITK